MSVLDRLGATVSATEAPSSSTPNAGIAIKTAVRAATTGAITLSGLQTIDGVPLAAGDRVLVKNQVDQTTNGIYNVGSGQWAASSDFQNNTQVASGLLVSVRSGATNAVTMWTLTTSDPITLGSSSITFLPAGTLVPIGNMTVATTVIVGGASSSTQYGVLFNKHGKLGDAAADPSLSGPNLEAGASIVVSSNSVPVPNIATSLGGGGTPGLFTVAGADEDEVVFLMAGFGTNSDATIALMKGRGTMANPLPLVAGDLIGGIFGIGWSSAGVNGGAPGTCALEVRALENFTPTANGTSWVFFAQLSGTAYPTGMTSIMQVNGGGRGGVTVGPVTNFYQPVAQDLGPGTVSVTGGLFANANAAGFQAAPASIGAMVHLANVDGTATGVLLDAFANAGDLVFRRADGTGASPTALQSGDLIGSIGALGMGATQFATVSRALINFVAAQNWTDTAQGTYIDLVTTANGQTTHVSALRVENDGGIRLQPATNPNASFGPGSISATGPIGVNVNAASFQAAPTGTALHVAQANGVETVALLDSYASDVALIFRRGDGTGAAPSALQSGDLIGGVYAQGMGATAFSAARASVAFFAAQNWSDTAQGAYLDLATTADNATTRTTRLRVENDGGITVPNTVTGGSQGAGTINVSGGYYLNGVKLIPERIEVVLRGVNFNSANSDNAIAITLPPGVTNYQIAILRIANASASLSTATWGLFSAAGGGGTAIFSAQATTVTSSSANTNNNSMAPTPANSGTQSFNFATLFFRVGTAEGSPATADVILSIVPL